MVQSQSMAVTRLQKTYAGGSDPESALQAAQTALRETRVRLFNDQQALEAAHVVGDPAQGGEHAAGEKPLSIPHLAGHLD